MILVSLFSEDNVLSDEIKICYYAEFGRSLESGNLLTVFVVAHYNVIKE